MKVTTLMQFEVNFGSGPKFAGPAETQSLRLNAGEVQLLFVRNPRARGYTLRVTEEGFARVTVPRSGSLAEARRFVDRHRRWLERQLVRQAARPRLPRQWFLGTEILFRGERVRLGAVPGRQDQVSVGPEIVRVRDTAADLRPELEAWFWNVAAQELPLRVQELAALHQFQVRRVSVRNQRSKWGSCSCTGTISLNWRLVQTPIFVRDYVILHELAHLRHMNHSASFWREVFRLCAEARQAEAWLKQNSELLR